MSSREHSIRILGIWGWTEDWVRLGMHSHGGQASVNIWMIWSLGLTGKLR